MVFLRSYYRTYYLFNNVDALRQELSWTHYRLLIKVDDERKRNFYEMSASNDILNKEIFKFNDAEYL